MDLVEIRKKANSKKKPARKMKEEPVEAFEQRQEVVTEEPIVEPEIAAAVEKEPVVEEAAPPLDDVSVAGADAPATADDADGVASTVEGEVEGDPIDALFAFKLEDGPAPTENYLQALVAGDEVVDNNIEQWLTFSLGAEEYALSIESVSEIIKPREVTDIPRAPDFISGIISLRGIIVPVFDLNMRLQLGNSEVGSASRIIVCQDGERLAGFIVDSINQVVNVPISNIEPPPTVLSGLDRDFVEGVGRVGDRMLILLHLSNVINAELV